MSDDRRGMLEPDDATTPEAVAVAEGHIRRYGVALGTTGVAAMAAWVLHAIAMGFPVVPMSWLALVLVGLVLAFFFPQTRKSRLAREVLRHWDEARVQGLLETSGASTDPRLRTAERMARRIVGHPAATDEMSELATALLDALRSATRDQRMIEVALDAPATEASGRRASLRDSLDYLEARAGHVLGTLAELHGAVVKRDETRIAAVLEQSGAVLEELRALDAVDRLLKEGDDGTSVG